MTTVPCSVDGCEVEGTRWVTEDVKLSRYAWSWIPKHIQIPRFLCDKHAKEFVDRVARETGYTPRF